MIVSAADVLAAFQQMWDADSDLATLVPGGLNQGRVPAEVSSPYASARVQEGEKQWNSSRVYVQSFIWTVTVWSEEGAEDVGEIQQAIAEVFDRDNYQDLEVGDARTIDLVSKPGSLEPDPATRNAKDVQMAVATYEAILQIER